MKTFNLTKTTALSFLLFCLNFCLNAQVSSTITTVTPISTNTVSISSTLLGGSSEIALPLLVCPGDQLIVVFDTLGNYAPDNVFTAELLVDANGGLGAVLGGLLAFGGEAVGSAGLDALGGLAGIPGLPGLGLFGSAPKSPPPINIGATQPGGSILDGLTGFIGGILNGGLTGGGGIPQLGGSQTIFGTIPEDIPSGIYSLRVISSSPADTSEFFGTSILIQAAEKPKVKISCNDDLIILTASQGNSFLWSTGSTVASISVPSITDNYSVTSYSFSGCSATTDTSVIGNPGFSGCPIYYLERKGIAVPNIFSPNNDDINDLLVIHNYGHEIKSVSIYNRWGNRVYNTATITDAWDGYSQNGLECASGMYYYVLETIPDSKYPIPLKGYFQLVR